MKKLFLLALTLAVVCGCQRFNIGPKGEGEYVIGSATVEYRANAISAMKKEAFRKAQYNALERAVRVFLSSSTLMEYPEAVKKDILGKQDNYIRTAYVKTAYRKGESYYMEVRTMVLVSDLSLKMKTIQDSSYIKKTNILVASRESVNGQVTMDQRCRQGIYKKLKGYPYALFDGGNLSQSNLDDNTSIVDKAKKDGARFVIIADASADPLEGAAQFASNFTTMRAKVNLKVVAASNYQLIAEAAESFSGLDAVQDIAVQKALTGACENAAGQVAEQIINAVNSAKTFQFTVNDVKTIERLEKLQTILRTLPEVEEFSLTKYNNSNATFDVQANVKSSEEFSAKIIRKYYANFGIQAVGPDYVEMQFL